MLPNQQIIVEEEVIDELEVLAIVLSSPGAQLSEMDTDGDGLTDYYEELWFRSRGQIVMVMV